MVRQMILGGCAALASLFIGVAQAEENDGWHGVRAIGAGVFLRQQPYLEHDDETQLFAIPYVSYDKGRIWLDGKQLGYILVEEQDDQPFELSALLDYRFQSYDAEDSLALAGMDDREGTLEAGAVATFRMGQARLLGQARFDVLDEHGGYDLVAQAEYYFRPHRATEIKPVLGFKWQSDDLTNYYYGVRPEEAVASIALPGGSVARPAYEPGETLSPFASLRVQQALSKKFAIGLYVEHEFLADEIKDSPIIDSDGITTVGVTLARIFID